VSGVINSPPNDQGSHLLTNHHFEQESSYSMVTSDDEMNESETLKDDENILHRRLDQANENPELEQSKPKRKYTSRKYMKKQLVCGHDEKLYHAKGLCKNCY